MANNPGSTLLLEVSREIDARKFQLVIFIPLKQFYFEFEGEWPDPGCCLHAFTGHRQNPRGRGVQPGLEHLPRRAKHSPDGDGPDKPEVHFSGTGWETFVFSILLNLSWQPVMVKSWKLPEKWHMMPECPTSD